ncbi:hypothetical protein NN6n1_41970 [Shinella zoogloeoides]
MIIDGSEIATFVQDMHGAEPVKRKIKIERIVERFLEWRHEKKGPATVAAVPDHGSTNPQKDTEMNEAMNTMTAPAPSSASIDIIDLHKTVENLWADALDVQRMARLLMSDLEFGLRVTRGRRDGDAVTLCFQEANIDVTLWLMGKLWAESDTLAGNLLELAIKLEKLS